MDQNNQKAARYSSEALAAIDELERKTEFTGWFLGRLRDRADELANEVLHAPMADRDREALRLRRLGVLEALSLLADEKKTHHEILNRMGFAPGDGKLTE